MKKKLDDLLEDIWNSYCFSREKSIIYSFEEFHRLDSNQFLKSNLIKARNDFIKKLNIFKLFIDQNFDHSQYINDDNKRGFRLDFLPNKNPEFICNDQYKEEFFEKLKELQSHVSELEKAYKTYQQKIKENLYH